MTRKNGKFSERFPGMKLNASLSLFFIFFSLAAFSQTTSPGWQDLFNGKDLTGWKALNGHAKFEVAGDEIVGTTVLKEPNSFLATEKDYDDFMLEFECKVDTKMNSGVQFRSESRPDTKDDKHPDAKLGSIGNRTLGSLYDLIPSVKQPRARKKIGEWNRGMIIVYPDGRIEHWLNGCKMRDYKCGTQYFYALVAKGKYKNWPNFGMAPKGHILL